jgi:putative ABC transport system permease protein
MAYLPRIQALSGVKEVAYAYWFEGTYIDPKHFFPQFAVSISRLLDIYPEYLLPGEEKQALLKDRKGCAIGRKLAARFGWRLGHAVTLKGTIFPGEYDFNVRAIYTGRDPSTDETQFFFHWDYLNERLKKIAPERADKVGWFFVQVESPELAPTVAERIDALFKNSLAETLTETEKAFQLSFVAMTEAILVAIQAVSWVVIGVILVVLANTMAMSARERLGEYAVLKTMGFRPHHLAGLILGESLILATVGGVLGSALTFPAIHMFPASLEQYFGVFPLTWETLAQGLTMSLTIGVLAALLPAWRAAQASIAEALKKVG